MLSYAAWLILLRRRRVRTGRHNQPSPQRHYPVAPSRRPVLAVFYSEVQMNASDTNADSKTIGTLELDLQLKNVPLILVQLDQVAAAAHRVAEAVASIGGMGHAATAAPNSLRRYRAVVEGIVEMRKKVAICESMKAEAQSALAAADKNLSYNLNGLVEAEAELAAIETRCLT